MMTHPVARTSRDIDLRGAVPFRRSQRLRSVVAWIAQPRGRGREAAEVAVVGPPRELPVAEPPGRARVQPREALTVDDDDDDDDDDDGKPRCGARGNGATSLSRFDEVTPVKKKRIRSIQFNEPRLDER